MGGNTESNQSIEKWDTGADYKLCIICQKSTSEAVIKPKEEPLVKVLKYMKQYSDLGDPNITSVFKRFGNLTAQNFYSKDAIYHKNCYSNVVNKRNLGRAIEGQKQAKTFYDATFILPKRGRPTSFSPRATKLEESSSTSNSAKRLRSTATPYNSSMCIICQKEGGILHKVETKPKGLKMFEVAKTIDGKSFFIHLNTLCNAADAVANDVQYHQRCWLYAQRNAKKTNNIHCDTDSIEIDDNRVISDTELLNVVKCEFDKKENTDLNMNNINNTYINLHQDNNHADINPNYKRYLKQLILENNPYGKFIKPRRKNESEKLCSAKEGNNIIDTALENVKDNMSNIFEIVRSIRKNIIKAKPSKFDDSFENYSAPEMLQTLIKWIIAGPRNELRKESNILIKQQIILHN